MGDAKVLKGFAELPLEYKATLTSCIIRKDPMPFADTPVVLMTETDYNMLIIECGELAAYKARMSNVEYAKLAAEPNTIDIGFEGPNHSRCWVKPEDVRGIIADLREKLRVVTKEHADLINRLRNEYETTRCGLH